MTKIKRTWDVLTDEKRKEVIKEIISFFQTERDEEIGVVAAGNVLDFFLQETVKDIYNKAIEDSKKLLKKRFDDLDLDLDLLYKTSK